MTIRRYITPVFALTLLSALSVRILAQEIRPDFSVGTPRYFLSDHLGSVRAIVDGNGDVEASYDYLPYGTLWSTSDSDYGNDYLFGGKEKQTILEANLYDSNARFLSTDGAFTSIDPQASRHPHINPYVYRASDPVNLIDPDGRIVRLANNYAGGIENIAKIAATSLGSRVMSHLIRQKDVYNLNSTFWTASSSYNPKSRDINYVGNPWYKEIPFDGGALNSMVAMGHETFHAFDHSNYVFNSANAGYSKDIVEPRAVSFGNYLRQAYSLSPLREQYGNIKGNFHQFTGNEEISNFTTLGNNSDKTSYGFSYTKTTTIVESYKTFLGIKTPDKTRTETATYYMTVSRDKNNNVSFQTFSNEEAYKKATSNW